MPELIATHRQKIPFPKFTHHKAMGNGNVH